MTMGHIFGFSPGLLPVYFLYFMLIYPAFAQEDADQTIKEHKIIVNKTLLGEDATLICSAKPAGVKLEWQLKEKPLKNSDRIKINSSEDGSQTTLLISHTTKDDRGNYSCIASTEKQKETKVELLELPFLGEFVVTNDSYVEIDRGKTVQLKCTFKMYYKPDNVTWSDPKSETEDTTVTALEDNRYISTRILKSVSYGQHNGVHTCTAFDKVNGSFVTGNVTLMVRDEPLVTLGHHLGIGKHQIYLNWTVEPRNSKINNYLFQIDSKYHSKPVEPNATSLIFFDLEPNKTYTIKMIVKTILDNKPHETQGPSVNVTTLVEDPVFVPNISINGFSATSVTVGWHAPPKEIEKFIHYYLLEARKKDEDEAPRKAYHSRDFRNLPYMFDNLKPYSTYLFKARACSDYTKECGAWSEEMPAATLDGIPGEPSDVDINCTSNLMYLSWEPPHDPRAEIKGYTMELTGFAEYKDRSGHMKKETWGPLSRFKGNESRLARFDDLQPNTNYTVRLSAMTRSRRRGEEASTSCFTSAALPDLPPRPRWRKILDNNKYLFKVFLPKVSERNGPICCYRVHVVRMPPNADLKSLKPQANMAIISYEEAHQDPAPLGSYITDIFSNNNFPKDSEFVIGDENYIFNQSETTLKLPSCLRCIKRPRPIPTTPATKLAPATTTEDDLLDDVTAEPTENKRERRSVDDGSDYSNSPTMSDSPSASLQDIAVKDGPLVSQFNYTVFVELIPLNVGDQILEPIYSDYLNILMPAPSAVAPAPSTALEIALQATCGVAALVLLLMVVFCVLQSRRSRKLPPHGHLEMGRLPPVFRFFWPTLGGRQALSSAAPPDMPPVARADLPAAYAERHADSDLGFQKEFELLQMLSECFPDRTTHASEARENQPKNRYPDIKAYDQTRVKLSQIDGITGSDYINANYVMGYKERKKFICAQGPTDTTVNDFWRMMWEHGLELIVMLTNLEEYSKVKCSKYWPDEARGSRAFGTINVRRVSETRYSDYIVRELKISKLPTNADGQPIVENNGVAKRNGDIGKQESVEGSAPTSPREGAEERTVRQYHYLTWRDFAAPEHPHCILKFIKRVNEAWTNMVGRPVVVHCSAGVGRTGTLVALDCLLEQLRATGQVAVFNTIAELRRQRNFLVQSQKQYVFVYRALVEYAHYGDTEIPAARLKTAIDRLRNTPEGADKCLMEHEFEKMIEAPVAEPVKSCAAGQAEEVRNKNRSQDCLPYDRNRVMLTPIPGRDYSTYINASFVEAYDNSEGFIITQDPLPTTIFDFWRMVSEQSVSTIVMLSELGEGKCPRYWDDGTAQYEHMSVVYDESESCPYYTRRQFRLTNTKTGHTQSVRQLQYQGWPTAPGHVPEVTRGLAELADAAAVSAGGDSLGPMVVHCNNGTERSALFVALCVLICQLRSERRVDVNAVARKVRSQRQLTIHTVLQYEFLHRAILNYAELHNLLEDS